MNKIKPILYLLLVVLGMVLLYNSLIAPMLMQNNLQMGMGMHWQMYSTSNYYIDIRYILLLIIIIAGVILFDIIKPQNLGSKCSKCGTKIEDDRWRKCPLCGTAVKTGKGDNR